MGFEPETYGLLAKCNFLLCHLVLLQTVILYWLKKVGGSSTHGLNFDSRRPWWPKIFNAFHVLEHILLLKLGLASIGIHEIHTSLSVKSAKVLTEAFGDYRI